MALLADAKHERGRAQLAALAAQQHMECSNLTAARRLLLQATHTYRRDGWQLLLAAALARLQDCCQRLRVPREALLCALELSCLPHGGSPAQIECAAAAALPSMLTGGGGQKSSILKAAAAAAPPAGPDALAGDAQHAQQGGSPGVLRYTVQYMDQAQAARLSAMPREDGSKQSMADILLQ